MKLNIERDPIISEGAATIQAVIMCIDEKRSTLDFVQQLDVSVILTDEEANGIVDTLNLYRDYYAYIDGWDGKDTDYFQRTGINVSWGKTAQNVKAKLEQLNNPKRTIRWEILIAAFFGGVITQGVLTVLRHFQ